MKQKILLLALLLPFFLESHAQKINVLTKSEKKAGWELLFNGENFNGWKKYNGKEISGWKVLDGVLHNSGEGSDHGGDIITKKQYENFELYLEWNISPLSNSGIFIHVQEEIVDKIYLSGPEYQLCDDKGVDEKRGVLRNKNQYTASGYAMYEAQDPQLKPIGEWNVTRILVNGSHVEHWLNGQKTVEYEFWSDDWYAKKDVSKWKDAEHYGMAKKGHIGIQDHGGLTKFRNIKIRKL
jgi:hypothetical protein